MNRLYILIACEESQTVCNEFRKLGHVAYSCDLQKCSGGHPEWHINNDVTHILNGHCEFTTQDGNAHYIEKWDLIIAHPPCTFLTLTGNRWFNVGKYGDKALKRLRDREDAVKFFMLFAQISDTPVAIENPIGVMSTLYRKPDQIIQPWNFGDRHRKATCLWLNNLPLLQKEVMEEPELDLITFMSKDGKIRTMDSDYAKAWSMKPEERQRFRSKTFPGIARAMAQQWSAYLMENLYRNGGDI